MGAAALPAAVGLQAGGGLFSAYMQGAQGKIQQGYYNYLSDTAKQNAGLVRSVSESNIKALGYQESQDQRRISERVKTVEGAQVAAEAAGGGGASSKTAEQIASDTANKGNLDEMALRYNASLKAKSIQTGANLSAFNYLNQAEGYEQAGRNAVTASKNAQIATVLGSGANIASSFQRFPGYGGYGGGGSQYAGYA